MVGGCVYIGLKDLTVDGDEDAKRCFWEVIDKGSEDRSTSEQIIRAYCSTHLIAPAGVLGPNHCPTSFLSSFLARAIRCRLNRLSGDGESKNHVKIWMYVQDGEVAASLERIRDADGKSKGNKPHPMWRCMRFGSSERARAVQRGRMQSWTESGRDSAWT